MLFYLSYNKCFESAAKVVDRTFSTKLLRKSSPLSYLSSSLLLSSNSTHNGPYLGSLLNNFFFYFIFNGAPKHFNYLTGYGSGIKLGVGTPKKKKKLKGVTLASLAVTLSFNRLDPNLTTAVYLTNHYLLNTYYRFCSRGSCGSTFLRFKALFAINPSLLLDNSFFFPVSLGNANYKWPKRTLSYNRSSFLDSEGSNGVSTPHLASTAFRSLKLGSVKPHVNLLGYSTKNITLPNLLSNAYIGTGCTDYYYKKAKSVSTKRLSRVNSLLRKSYKYPNTGIDSTAYYLSIGLLRHTRAGYLNRLKGAKLKINTRLSKFQIFGLKGLNVPFIASRNYNIGGSVTISRHFTLKCNEFKAFKGLNLNSGSTPTTRYPFLHSALSDPKGLRRVPLVPSVRYKPGLSTYWRIYRRWFNQFFGLKRYRQWRVTRYVSRLCRVSSLAVHYYFFFSLLGVVLSSGIFIDLTATSTLLLITCGYWAVNGTICRLPLFQLFYGDFVTLAGTGSHIRALSIVANSRKNTEGKLSLRDPLVNTHGSIPEYSKCSLAYLEVDDLCLSIYVLPTTYRVTSSSNNRPNRVTLRLLNWKYAT